MSFHVIVVSQGEVVIPNRSVSLSTLKKQKKKTKKKKTSCPKGNDRSPESQQVKSQTYFEYFLSERAIGNSNVSSLKAPEIKALQALNKGMSLLQATLMMIHIINQK